MFTIKVQVIRNTAHRPSTQASYTIGPGTTMQEIQPAAQIAAKHNIFPIWRHICHATFWCRWESIPGSLAWEARELATTPRMRDEFRPTNFDGP